MTHQTLPLRVLIDQVMTMNVKLLLLTLALLLAASPVFAQTFRPLAGYEDLRERQAGKARMSADKMACGEFDLSGYALFLPGESRSLPLGIDTAGLGSGTITYSCVGCTTAAFGSATVSNDTLFYGADAGAEQGLDTLTVTACNGAGTCTDPVTVVVLVQRGGRMIELGNQDVAPRAVIEVLVPDGDLPGGTFCRMIEQCAPDYPGRGQRFSFLTGADQGNDFRYVAAGYGGEDAICVTLCNELGLCDVYRTTLTINVPTQSLPFFDDFAYDGIRPNPALWQDDDVLVNRNFAIDPPSIGVATFDGVDFGGQPYPEGSGGQSTVIRDYLTSAPLDLRGQVNPALSFYLQPRGYGNRPETQDSFLVQFLHPDGTWQTVFQQEGLRTTESNVSDRPFIRYELPVTSAFRYTGFQFRFAGKSSERGAVDMWHVDYVTLDDLDRIDDVALVDRPGFLLAPPYTSMPIRHLRAGGPGLLRDSLAVKLRHNGTQPKTIQQTSIFGVRNAEPFSVDPLSPADFNRNFFELTGGSNGIAGGEIKMPATPFNAALDGYDQLTNFLFRDFDENGSYKLSLYYELDINPEEVGALATNNNVDQLTCFDEYFAYDDGTAEVTIEGNAGTTILQRYEAFVADELQAIRVRIPRGLRSLGSQDLRLAVYSELDGVPDTLRAFYDFPILYAEDFHLDSLQGYTTYVLPEPLALEPGNFFVGWEQQPRAASNIGIGFDRNSTPEGVQYFNNGNGWSPITGTTTGAIMIRPLLSGFEGFTTSTPAAPAAPALVEIFPNPTNGTLHLRPRPLVRRQDLRYQLFSITGALLAANQFADRIELGQYPAGIYVLEVTDGTMTSQHKIVRR